jgi:carboxyl-terminal processing protease
MLGQTCATLRRLNVTVRKLSLMAALTALVLTAMAALRGVDSRPRAATDTAAAGPAETAKAAAHTNPATRPLGPGPYDSAIAYVTARLLEQNHYRQHPLDNEYSEKFFDRYLSALDPQHLHFTQEDIAEFEKYRDRLDDLTLAGPRTADTGPAYVIFNRFLERLEQRAAYADELLKTEKFDFTSDERMLANRRDAPYPKDLAEAKQLWRQRLRFEYLQEKLARIEAKKKPRPLAAVNGTSPATVTATRSNPAPTPDGETRTATATATHAAAPHAAAPTPAPETDAEEIVDLLERRYNRTLHIFKEWDSEDVLERYLTSLAHVYDPHSDYMNKIGAENFAIGMNLALIGIGAVLTTDLDGYCKIQELKPGPAMKSKKIKVGDRIVAVAQSNAPPVDVVDMNLNKTVQLIRGPKGTEVRLTIIPVDHPSERRVVSLIREEIKLEDQEVKAKIIELPGAAGPTRLGVIDLPTFYATIDRPLEVAGGGADAGETQTTPRSTSVDVAKILKKFNEEHVGGVILDLRRNGGGSLDEAIRLTGLFIKQGPVVQVRTSDGSELVRSDRDPRELYTGPLIVLTSRFSASASEIVAGALQDYGRAVIVGDISTHGKGTVQNLNPLRFYRPTATATNDPGQVKITIQKFYRPSGASTQLKGVAPDIVLPSVWNYSKDIGEDALENPLPWDPIASVKYDKFNLVTPCLPELLKRSQERVEKDKDFAYIREDIALFRKEQADKTISLNEQKRLKEREDAEARQKARDQERRGRPEPNRTIYEITLKDADRPGLPPPVAASNTVARVEGELREAGPARPAAAAPAATTNLVAAAAPAVTATGLDDEDDAGEKRPTVDPTLEETERILVDYISLLAQKNLLSANR